MRPWLQALLLTVAFLQLSPAQCQHGTSLPPISDLPLTTHTCPEDGSDFTRICVFTNLALIAGNLTYLYKGDKPYLPKVLTKFHSDVSGDVYLHLVMQDVRTLPASILTQPVLQLGPSVFEDVNHPVNYYHNIGENLPAFYFKACRYLGHCDDTSARLFLNQRAESYLPNSTRLYDKFDDWAEWLPWFQPFISCLTDHPVRHPRHPSFANQTGIMSKAVFGVGPDNRHYTYWQTEEYRQHWSHPDPQLIQGLRGRMSRCFGIDPQPRQAGDPVQVLIVQRGDHERRHLLNAGRVRRHILEDFSHVKAVRIFRSEEHSIKEQVEAFMRADVIVLTHGSALGNLLFMKEGAVVISYFYHEEIHLFSHRWAAEFLLDLGFPVQLIAVTCTDPSYAEWDRLALLKHPEYQQLSDADKLKLLEFKTAANASLVGLDHQNSDPLVYHSNYLIDYYLFQKGLNVALNSLSTGIWAYSYVNITADNQTGSGSGSGSA